MFCNKYCGSTSSIEIQKLIILDKITFHNFVLKLQELNNLNILNTNKSDIHINKQFLNLKKKNNTYIIKLENFYTEIIQVYSNLGFNELIPNIIEFIDNNENKYFFHKTPRTTETDFIYNKIIDINQQSFPDYKYFYNQELLDIVYEIYEEDFINFNYKKDIIDDL
jgi:hypothetical protein